MKDGHKVRHRYFDHSEWMIMDGGKFKFEDNVRCDFNMFWQDRNGPDWQIDWEIYKEI